MKKLVCYYAHTMTSYGSTIETSDIQLLESLGFDVLNPNTEEIQLGLKEYIEKNGTANVMEFFRDVIYEKCDMLAFRSIPNGQILSGVAKEITYAQDLGLPIIELPCSIAKRSMEYLETKQYLIELGHYKI